MENNDVLIEMGKRINNRRKELGFTQESLAEMINVSTVMISNLERGKKAIRPENLISVAKALNTSTDYLLTGYYNIKDHDRIYDMISELSERDYKLVESLIKYLRNN